MLRIFYQKMSTWNSYILREFLKALHAYLLPYEDSHIVMAILLNHFYTTANILQLYYVMLLFSSVCRQHGFHEITYVVVDRSCYYGIW
jgi:hypothetical protein